MWRIIETMREGREREINKEVERYEERRWMFLVEELVHQREEKNRSRDISNKYNNTNKGSQME